MTLDNLDDFFKVGFRRRENQVTTVSIEIFLKISFSNLSVKYFLRNFYKFLPAYETCGRAWVGITI